VRVIGGILKGRRLQICRAKSLRPTSGKIREAIFDILAPLLVGGSVLDLYAGTGSFGVEALSRGMDKAVFVEHDPIIISFLKKNITYCQLGNETEIIGVPVSKGLKILKSRKEQFELIFLDPPYQEKLAGKTLLEISEANLVTPDSVVIVEHSSKEILERVYGGLKMDDQRKYGQSLVSFFSIMCSTLK